MTVIKDNGNVIEFDWDKGNFNKSEKGTGILYKECESVFLQKPVILKDFKHSHIEKRLHCLGKSNNQKLLLISFTYRGNKIRIISARPASRKERKNYEKIKKNT